MIPSKSLRSCCFTGIPSTADERLHEHPFLYKLNHQAFDQVTWRAQSAILDTLGSACREPFNHVTENTEDGTVKSPCALTLQMNGLDKQTSPATPRLGHCSYNMFVKRTTSLRRHLGLHLPTHSFGVLTGLAWTPPKSTRKSLPPATPPSITTFSGLMSLRNRENDRVSV